MFYVQGYALVAMNFADCVLLLGMQWTDIYSLANIYRGFSLIFCYDVGSQTHRLRQPFAGEGYGTLTRKFFPFDHCSDKKSGFSPRWNLKQWLVALPWTRLEPSYINIPAYALAGSPTTSVHDKNSDNSHHERGWTCSFYRDCSIRGAAPGQCGC